MVTLRDSLKLINVWVIEPVILLDLIRCFPYFSIWKLDLDLERRGLGHGESVGPVVGRGFFTAPVVEFAAVVKRLPGQLHLARKVL
mmetsp:Transcript_23892/g.66308  ORF Transcript_23892/g.66308 Transcript_23892/m.66308 type:complete len:86 (-) Transcript_23892:85-342(-)